MIKALVYAEARDGVIQSITHELINAARQLTPDNVEVVACVLGADAGEIAKGLGGADRILLMQHEALSPYTPDAHADGLKTAIDNVKPDVVLIGYTTAGLDLASNVSLATERALVGYCTSLSVENGQLLATSQLYRGKLVAKTTTPLPAVAVVVPGNFDDSPAAAGQSETSSIEPPPSIGTVRVRFVSSSAPDAGEVDLTRADRIVCVGRGLGSDDKLAIAQDLATALGAELAGSRPVIDSGWLPKARQVGKSGQKVKPKLYLSMGVSGAPEHLEGMKNADFIIAINSDEKAPIFEVADIGTTCDMFELVPALTAKLR